jgi:hypothetical protein
MLSLREEGGRQMRRMRFTIILFALAILIGCDGALVIQAPELKAVVMGSTYVTAFWEKNSTIENNSDFVGYDIYVYTDSSALLVEDGEGLNKFNSVVIRDTTYQINGLSQDSIYYIQVRTVNTDNVVGGYNSITPFLKASPRPEFSVTMRIADPIQPVNDSCALRFSDGTIMADSAMVSGGADMWLVITNDTLSFQSPSIYGPGTRTTYFVNNGPGDFELFFRVTNEPDTLSVRFDTGDIVVAKTEDGNYVKIYVEEIVIQNNMVTFIYAYQNIAGFPYF